MIILLDIDGVMSPIRSWRSAELMDDGFLVFSQESISVIQKIITSDTTIILTSSHRFKYSIEDWKLIFKNRNIIINNLLITDENKSNLSRREEIINWFNINKCDSFIIIDDDTSLNDLPSKIKNNLILTSSLIGLTNKHLEEISSIIKRY
jgi:hypothetical protein